MLFPIMKDKILDIFFKSFNSIFKVHIVHIMRRNYLSAPYKSYNIFL